jgi:signal transduction histidine kinase
VYVSRTQLAQVLVNLLNNAIEAMPEGGHLDLSAYADGDTVCIDVANDGPRLTQDELEHVFDPYFTTKPGHPGIGLWITRRIVEAHEGLISVANRPGNRGVVFTVKLPSAGTGQEQEAVA